MTAPSVITPRSASKLKKAKQLSGTATASNKSRFMGQMCLSLASPPNERNRRSMSNDAKLERCHDYLTDAAVCALDASTGAA